MLARDSIIGKPDRLQLNNRLQIVDMPVRVGSNSRVMADARGQAARSEGTADIDIRTAVDSHSSQFAYCEISAHRREQDQGVCSRL